MRVFIYWNLRRKCFSVKAMEGPDKGKVIDHVRYFEMEDVTFKVSEAGRQRVLRERRKNVHAGLVGKLAYSEAVETQPRPEPRTGSAKEIVYNPYRDEKFKSVSLVLRLKAEVVKAPTARGYAARGRATLWADDPQPCACGGFRSEGAFVHADRCQR